MEDDDRMPAFLLIQLGAGDQVLDRWAFEQGFARYALADDLRLAKAFAPGVGHDRSGLDLGAVAALLFEA
jgi:hypothetical protein